MDLLLNACEKLEKVWDYARGELRENVSRKDLGRAMAAVDLLNDSDLKGDDFDLAQLLSQTVKKAAAAYTLERGDSIPEGVPGNDETNVEGTSDSPAFSGVTLAELNAMLHDMPDEEHEGLQIGEPSEPRVIVDEGIEEENREWLTAEELQEQRSAYAEHLERERIAREKALKRKQLQDLWKKRLRERQAEQKRLEKDQEGRNSTSNHVDHPEIRKSDRRTEYQSSYVQSRTADTPFVNGQIVRSYAGQLQETYGDHFRETKEQHVLPVSSGDQYNPFESGTASKRTLGHIVPPEIRKPDGRAEYRPSYGQNLTADTSFENIRIINRYESQLRKTYGNYFTGTKNPYAVSHRSDDQHNPFELGQTLIRRGSSSRAASGMGIPEKGKCALPNTEGVHAETFHEVSKHPVSAALSGYQNNYFTAVPYTEDLFTIRDHSRPGRSRSGERSGSGFAIPSRAFSNAGTGSQEVRFGTFHSEAKTDRKRSSAPLPDRPILDVSRETNPLTNKNLYQAYSAKPGNPFRTFADRKSAFREKKQSPYSPDIFMAAGRTAFPVYEREKDPETISKPLTGGTYKRTVMSKRSGSLPVPFSRLSSPFLKKYLQYKAQAKPVIPLSEGREIHRRYEGQPKERNETVNKDFDRSNKEKQDENRSAREKHRMYPFVYSFGTTRMAGMNRDFGMSLRHVLKSNMNRTLSDMRVCLLEQTDAGSGLRSIESQTRNAFLLTRTAASSVLFTGDMVRETASSSAFLLPTADIAGAEAYTFSASMAAGANRAYSFLSVKKLKFDISIAH